MLKIGKIRAGRLDYYLEVFDAHARSDAFDRPGDWIGVGARILGLGGEALSLETVQAVFASRDPGSGASLHPGRDRVTIIAYDLTFSAPKSVSLLGALGGSDTSALVVDAHRMATRATLSYLERHGATVRRSRQGRRAVEVATGLIAAEFLHETSRADDPHLHSHVVVANLAAGRDGRYSALDARGLHLEARAAGSLYELELRAELSARLGVVWRQSEAGHFELAGVPDALRRAFSKRQAAIAEELRAFGRASPASREIAAMRTRPAKVASDSEVLEARWHDAAQRQGIASSRWRQVAPGHDRALGPADLRKAAAAALEGAPLPSTRRELLALAAADLASGGRIEALERELDALLADTTRVRCGDDQVTHLGRGARTLPSGRSEPRFVARGHLETEQRLLRALASARSLGEGPHFPPCGLIVVEDSMERQLLAACREARRTGRPVRWLAPERAAVPEYLARFGIAARRTDLSMMAYGPSRAAVSVVVSAERAGLRALAQASEAAAQGLTTLVLVLETRGPGSDRATARLARLLRERVQHVVPPGARVLDVPELGREARGERRPERSEPALERDLGWAR